MSGNTFYLGAVLALFLVVARVSYAVDITNLADQSSLRCSGGIVATGDSDRTVGQKCGEPMDVQSKQDVGFVWIYNFGQSRYMYYLAFQNGRLQRIVSAPCSVNDDYCYDLR
jgi:hypothetical protein